MFTLATYANTKALQGPREAREARGSGSAVVVAAEAEAVVGEPACMFDVSGIVLERERERLRERDFNPLV